VIRIALRLDDPSPTSDQELESKLLNLLASLSIPLTVAVIPIGSNGERISADNVPHLFAAQAAGLLEVAQHGLSHDPLSTSMAGVPSEFVDVPMEEQRRRIRLGREILEKAFSTSIAGFVPPWNTLDSRTVQVLTEEGFSYASISSETRLGHRPERLSIQPHTCNIRQLEAAYMHAKHRVNSDVGIIAILHHYDFQTFHGGNNIKPMRLEDLAGTLAWLAEDPKVQFVSVAGLNQTMAPLQSWKAYIRRCRVVRMNWRLRQLFPRYQVLSHPLWYYLVKRQGHAEH
jgi:peptidoglycan/xylan/chitin deacetylase (PgdA/CDA1 family)